MDDDAPAGVFGLKPDHGLVELHGDSASVGRHQRRLDLGVDLADAMGVQVIDGRHQTDDHDDHKWQRPPGAMLAPKQGDPGTALDVIGAVFGHCRRRMRMTLVKAKITATVTVIRSRFFSTTVDPAAADPTDPPNMSESPPPFPLCMRMRKIRPKEASICNTTMMAVSTASFSFDVGPGKTLAKSPPSPGRGPHNGHEGSHVKAGPAYQRPVHVGAAE